MWPSVVPRSRLAVKPERHHVLGDAATGRVLAVSVLARFVPAGARCRLRGRGASGRHRLAQRRGDPVAAFVPKLRPTSHDDPIREKSPGELEVGLRLL
jgi:hypothetical protein